MLNQIKAQQINIPKIENPTNNDDDIQKDSILSVLRKQNKVVLIYNVGSAWDTQPIEYSIIALSNENKWNSYLYKKWVKKHELFNTGMAEDSIMKTWDAFVDNGLFEIKDEKDIVLNCPATIQDGVEYNFMIITKNMYKRLHYEEPEYCEKNCSSVYERRQIIKCIKILWPNFGNLTGQE